VVKVYQERILLTGKDILEKEFKIDTRGYRPQEVDKFLDVIIRDYEEFISIIKELENDKKELLEDNIRLKQEIRSLKTKLEVIKEGSNKDVSNVDLLRRLSNLEKIIYGDED
jgi:DivIVA domain-containing protein